MRSALILLEMSVALLSGATSGAAKTPASRPGAGPVFVPGLYVTESRNADRRARGLPVKTCIAAADADAFQRETVARFLVSPQFRSVCRLSAPHPLPDGFVMAMDCGTATSIMTYRLAKDLVSLTTETKIDARPGYSSTILTLSRRIGDCRAPTPLDLGRIPR